MSLKATIILKGGSLLRQDFSNEIEIEARPLDLSLSGICITLDLKAHWANIAPHKDVEMILERGHDRQFLRGEIMHMSPGGRRLGVRFAKPLQNMANFLVPHELQ